MMMQTSLLTHALRQVVLSPIRIDELAPNKAMTDKQKTLYAAMPPLGEKISTDSLHVKTGLSKEVIRRHMAGLRDMGLVSYKDGARKNLAGYWSRKK